MLYNPITALLHSWRHAHIQETCEKPESVVGFAMKLCLSKRPEHVPLPHRAPSRKPWFSEGYVKMENPSTLVGLCGVTMVQDFVVCELDSCRTAQFDLLW